MPIQVILTMITSLVAVCSLVYRAACVLILSEATFSMTKATLSLLPFGQSLKPPVGPARAFQQQMPHQNNSLSSRLPLESKVQTHLQVYGWNLHRKPLLVLKLLLHLLKGLHESPEQVSLFLVQLLNSSLSFAQPENMNHVTAAWLPPHVTPSLPTSHCSLLLPALPPLS